MVCLQASLKNICMLFSFLKQTNYQSYLGKKKSYRLTEIWDRVFHASLTRRLVGILTSCRSSTKHFHRICWKTFKMKGELNHCVHTNFHIPLKTIFRLAWGTTALSVLWLNNEQLGCSKNHVKKIKYPI